VIPVALAGALIRTGNFFNSEIVGKYTEGFFGVHFVRHFDSELGHYDQLPRIPIQLYEAICYFIIFGGLYWYYWKTKGKFAPGLLFGAFFTTVFGIRFVLEFWKVADIYYGGLTTGHVLSIPVVIVGLIIWINALKNQKKIAVK